MRQENFSEAFFSFKQLIFKQLVFDVFQVVCFQFHLQRNQITIQ